MKGTLQMKKAGTLILCALLAFFPALPALSEIESRRVASVGNFTITEDMVRLFCLQDEAAKVIADMYGLGPSIIDKTGIDTQTAERQLQTACAAAQAALDAGISVSVDTVKEMIDQELVNYPSSQGQEYFGEYARYVSGRFGGDLDGLISTAVPLRRIELLAAEYLSLAVNGRLKNKTDEESAQLLAEELKAVPCARGDGAACEPSNEWLLENIFLLRGIR